MDWASLVRRRRISAEFDPRTAPHAALVRSLVTAHVPKLQARLRGHALETLALRVLDLERSPVPLQDESPPAQLAIIALRLQQIIGVLEVEEQALTRKFAAFNHMYMRHEDVEERRYLIASYLKENITDPEELAADLLALDRYLGLDALRERHNRAVLACSIQVELALIWLAEAVPKIAAHDDGDQALGRLGGARLPETCAAGLIGGRRWQVRWAAGRALVALAELVADGLSLDVRAALGDARRAAGMRDDHPWVQAAGLEAAVLLDPDNASTLISERLFAAEGSRDHFVRKLALQIALRRLPPAQVDELVSRCVAGVDRSDHVRLGLVEIALQLGWQRGGSHLAVLAGVAQPGETSPKVQGAAAIAIRRLAARAARYPSDDLTVRAAAQLLVRIPTQRGGFPVVTMCEELTGLAGDLAANAPHLLDELAPLWLDALGQIIADDDTSSHIAETAAAAAEAIERERDPTRRTVTRELERVIAAIPSGRRGVAKLPEGLPVDEDLMGRVLADLTRRSWGASASLRAGRWIIWRGDRFRRRLWRILHEVRSPLPNKRQAWVHTVGRTYPGELRAHPGLLEEATATTVPGERVNVDSEGSWCRHLPQIDDLVELSITRPRPVRIISSLGTTIVAPPARLKQRLRNWLAIAWSYRRLAGLRLASLRAYRDPQRRRYIELLAADYGIEVRFEPHSRPGLAGHAAPLSRNTSELFTNMDDVRMAGADNAAESQASDRCDTAERAAEHATPSDVGSDSASIVRPHPDGVDSDAADGSSTGARPGLGPNVRHSDESSSDVADEEAEPVAPTAPLTALALPAPLEVVRRWFADHAYYFSSPSENSQTALVAFAGVLAAVFWTRGWVKRWQVDSARRAIPMTIGGWGTRGKSGTERLKAGLLDGLGFDVFVKTTGCEAMFIHSAPLQQPVEIFIYRPYDKATIWEQMALVRLGARLRCQAFLWECMALNPKYVQLLQHDWMHDDIVTLTNCYPDHEDIQGPVGFNVAQVITEFIPTRSTLVTSETSYLPMFQDVCARRGTTMYTVGERESELIADDVLELFPYREHPRNIALVTRVAEELGIDPDLARLTMAENVVADLGVLKAYPRARVRGRYLAFVCGNSANERTGFINNWRRMKLDKLDYERDPDKLVVTVVNNRADRIARSEVFARILVRDVAFDRHVLIGTNLRGLRGFLETALDDYLNELSLIEIGELKQGEVPPVVAARVGRELGNLRIPPATAESALVRLAIYARPAGLAVAAEKRAELAAAIAPLFDGDVAAAVDIAVVRRALTDDRRLASTLDAALIAATEPQPLDDFPETLADPTRDEVVEPILFELARMQIRSRLEARVRNVFSNPTEAARQEFLTAFAAAYRAMFLAQVITVEDSGATGDQIIEQCARCVPPGSDVCLMGTQNIKGTGLDFVYRWLALDKVVSCLREQAGPRHDRRMAALVELEAFEDHGMVDTGFARAMLAREPAQAAGPDELAARQRIAAKVEAIWQHRTKALAEQRKAGVADRVAAWGEGWLDWIDSIRRGNAAAAIIDDLVAARISHQRASVEMRKVVGRLKGGWLIKALRRAK